MNFRDEKEPKRLFQKLPLYNAFIGRPRIKYLRNIDLLNINFLYGIDNWINEESGWVIQPINGEYVNISYFTPLSGSSYIFFFIT